MPPPVARDVGGGAGGGRDGGGDRVASRRGACADTVAATAPAMTAAATKVWRIGILSVIGVAMLWMETLSKQAPLWAGVATFAVVALVAGLADRARTRRDRADAVGFMPWPTVQMAAIMVAVVLAALAITAR